MVLLNEPTKFVTFRLDRELYALSIDQVREVLDYTSMTKVPRMPEFMRGVINLRGSVVPVVDLRLKFGMEPAARTVDTRIIIVEITVDGEITVLGALADSVNEVIELEPDQVGPAPRIGTRLRTDFIRGMGRKDDEFIIILNVDQIFSTDELAVVQAMEQTAVESRSASGSNGTEEPMATF
jgi:purine-binding chemotaxis protein CheW